MDSEPNSGRRIAFVCVRNAGRSQMATAYAEREKADRGLEDLEIVTGGTHPVDDVHEVVAEAMAEEGFDLSDRTPQEVSTETLETCDRVATMGCSTLELDAGVDVRDWDLPDPGEEDLERVREIREEVRERVSALFDELESDGTVEAEREG
ncbi:Protein-tyrosine-phosphatase [Halobiforma haloterrestris]|uniref:Protein-tyrosine-phosphatase n=1 Tax=Natronobacterium haloterrestre TaxID=148448 RepID=A0A1I1K303_NATHA|nr:low molecular weight phosphatase family protein [Halobiforma haloterrestris]SFC55106.1 Protein-tyrosine-phosphatase [Halobiforma haloterrestris]